jgi:hypothetical protein
VSYEGLNKKTRAHYQAIDRQHRMIAREHDRADAAEKKWHALTELTLFMHTAKAVGRSSAVMSAPDDRVFLCVETDGRQFLAWKCRLTPRGLEHPAFKQPLSLNEFALWRGMIVNTAHNGSEPTAVFKPDSFYRRVTIEQLCKAKPIWVRRNRAGIAVIDTRKL